MPLGKLLQSCLTLCDPIDYSPRGSSVHGGSPGKNTGVVAMSLVRLDSDIFSALTARGPPALITLTLCSTNGHCVVCCQRFPSPIRTEELILPSCWQCWTSTVVSSVPFQRLHLAEGSQTWFKLLPSSPVSISND